MHAPCCIADVHLGHSRRLGEPHEIRPTGLTLPPNPGFRLWVSLLLTGLLRRSPQPTLAPPCKPGPIVPWRRKKWLTTKIAIALGRRCKPFSRSCRPQRRRSEALFPNPPAPSRNLKRRCRALPLKSSRHSPPKKDPTPPSTRSTRRPSLQTRKRGYLCRKSTPSASFPLPAPRRLNGRWPCRAAAKSRRGCRMRIVKLELASAPTCAAGVRGGFFKTTHRIEFSSFLLSRHRSWLTTLTTRALPQRWWEAAHNWDKGRRISTAESNEIPAFDRASVRSAHALRNLQAIAR
jgi:hypothetical protein